jgi:hypothetical protein
MNVLFHRQTDAGMQETEGGFRTQVFTAGDSTDIEYADLRVDLDREVDRFTNVGSGWTLTAILKFIIRVGQYRPLSGPSTGSSFIPTPKSLMMKHAIVNVYNPDDNLCFAWAVLSAIHPCERNAERISKYRPFLNTIDLSGLKFPVAVNQVSRFEKNNPDMSVNVYAFVEEGQEIIPKYVTRCYRREKHVDLMLLSSETSDNCHYFRLKT